MYFRPFIGVLSPFITIGGGRLVGPWVFNKQSHIKHIPYHPWDWYIYLHGWLMFMVNVGKYTSPMDGMGMIYTNFKKMQLTHRKGEIFCCFFSKLGVSELQSW